MEITRETKLSDLLVRYPWLKEELAKVNDKFKMLKLQIKKSCKKQQAGDKKNVKFKRKNVRKFIDLICGVLLREEKPAQMPGDHDSTLFQIPLDLFREWNII